MATKETCKHYGECGFAEWRVSEVNLEAIPLPKNGDCGIKPWKCPRMNPHSNIITLGNFGPSTSSELEIAFPKSRERPGKDTHR